MGLSRSMGNAMLHFKSLVELGCQQLPFFDITQASRPPTGESVKLTGGRRHETVHSRVCCRARGVGAGRVTPKPEPATRPPRLCCSRAADEVLARDDGGPPRARRPRIACG